MPQVWLFLCSEDQGKVTRLGAKYVLNIGVVEVVSNETNTDVRMYNLFIR